LADPVLDVPAEALLAGITVAPLLLVLAAVVIVCCFVLPIVAIRRTNQIIDLRTRIASLEAALDRLIPPKVQAIPVETPPVEPPPDVAPPPPSPAPLPVAAEDPSEHLELLIGRKVLGWIAMAVIFCAAVYFLKYAFENRWIGELGRVTLEVAFGLAIVITGHQRYRKGWRYLSQILIGGGIIILYLSFYGAFGYYHLIDQRSAFVFLAILVAETHLLAVAYGSPPIAVMALIGGFLIPVILSTGHDQYRVLFTYIGLMDLGVLGMVIAKRWRWIGSLAYLGSQALFWLWYNEHYHPEKRLAAVGFQAAIFLLFILVDSAPALRKNAAGTEELLRLIVNPFVFFATCYALLDGDYHDWMAPLAIALAIVYTVLARAEFARQSFDSRMLLVTIGTALCFVTVAIPVQLESNWITIAWAVEAVALLWAALETESEVLRGLSAIVFALAVFRFLGWDTPWAFRPPFTPVLNRYFLGMLALVVCLAVAAYLTRRLGVAGISVSRETMVCGFVAFGVLWLGTSFEAYSYFGARAEAAVRRFDPDSVEISRQLRWAGQLAVSVLWSGYAGLLAAGGFRFKAAPLRIAALVLFGLTLCKVFFVDTVELRQFYRIVAVFALGMVLLVVAWAYQRALRKELAK
jgi:uncharacterized membrane protein